MITSEIMNLTLAGLKMIKFCYQNKSQNKTKTTA